MTSECSLASVQVGMMVKCCRTYEEVYDGDVGKVIKLDRDGLHDLNVQCDWQQKGGTYWVRYIHIELLGKIMYPECGVVLVITGSGKNEAACFFSPPSHMGHYVLLQGSHHKVLHLI